MLENLNFEENTLRFNLWPSVEPNAKWKNLTNMGLEITQQARLSVSPELHKLLSKIPKDNLLIKSCDHQFDVMPENAIFHTQVTPNETGYDYIKLLAENPHLPRNFRLFCKNNFLPKPVDLTPESSERILKHFKLIEFKLLTDPGPIQQAIESIAIEGLAYGFDCNSHSNRYFLNEMYGIAYLEQVKSTRTNATHVLFNLGLTQCKIQALEFFGSFENRVG